MTWIVLYWPSYSPCQTTFSLRPSGPRENMGWQGEYLGQHKTIHVIIYNYPTPVQLYIPDTKCFRQDNSFFLLKPWKIWGFQEKDLSNILPLCVPNQIHPSTGYSVITRKGGFLTSMKALINQTFRKRSKHYGYISISNKDLEKAQQITCKQCRRKCLPHVSVSINEFRITWRK